MRDSMLPEFGGRNITEPNETYPVRPDVAVDLDELFFQKALFSLLSL
ncbi:MAG: hypothetical protein Q8L72_02510 [Moraxellaceae bacterium]|nr:hypothetical protein [Moraxellaceae bacterium]